MVIQLTGLYAHAQNNNKTNWQLHDIDNHITHKAEPGSPFRFFQIFLLLIGEVTYNPGTDHYYFQIQAPMLQISGFKTNKKTTERTLTNTLYHHHYCSAKMCYLYGIHSNIRDRDS